MSHIEGVPLGTKIERVGSARPEETIIDGQGRPFKWNHLEISQGVYPIIVPDNVYNVLDLSTVAIPEGDKRAAEGWFREPRLDERYLSINRPHHAVINAGQLSDGDKRRIILEPIKPRTRKVLVVEYELPDNHQAINGLGYCNGCYSDRIHPVPFSIEERPV